MGQSMWVVMIENWYLYLLSCYNSALTYKESTFLISKMLMQFYNSQIIGVILISIFKVKFTDFKI